MSSCRPSGRQLASALVAGAVLAALPATAPAAVGWSPVAELAPTSADYPLQVAMDDRGSATAIFGRYDVDAGQFRAAVVERPAGGAWTEPEFLSASDQGIGYPYVAVNGRGDAVAVFFEWRSGVPGGVLKARRRAAGGTSWGPVETILATASSPAYDPKVVVDAEGAVTVVWHAIDDDHEVVVARSTPAAPAWKVATLAGTDPGTGMSDYAPQIAINDAGDVAVVWSATDFSPKRQSIRAARLPAGSSAWSLSDVTAATGYTSFQNTAITVGPGGVPTVGYSRWDGTHLIAVAATMRTDGSWDAHDLSAPGAHVSASSIRLRATDAGELIAAWRRGTSAEAAVRAADGTWSATAPAGSLSPSLMADDQGNAAVLTFSDGNPMAAPRPAGGAFASPFAAVTTETPASIHSAATATDEAGNGVAVWRRHPDRQIRAIGYDAAGPLLEDLTMPSDVEAGTAAAFSVAPLDVWSALGTTTWSFGDGESATGSDVRHTYARAGTYSVTVTATDALGNATAATHDVTVTGAAGGKGPEDDQGAPGGEGPKDGQGAASATGPKDGQDATEKTSVSSLLPPVGLVPPAARTFGAGQPTNVTLGGRSTTTMTSSGTVNVGVQNANPFPLAARLTFRPRSATRGTSPRAAAAAKRLAKAMGTTLFVVPKQGSSNVALKLTPAARTALRRRGGVSVVATLKLRDPSRSLRTVRRQMTVRASRR